VEATLTATTEKVTSQAAELETFYLFWAATLVFSMQMGFAMLSAGAVRQKNVQNIMLKGLLDACLGAIVWYLFGYGLAYDFDTAGEYEGNGFIGGGRSNFALAGHVSNNGFSTGQASDGADWVGWFFQYAFAAAAATIVSGAVAERCQLTAYLVYTVAITGLIYPAVVHWVWDGAGFLSAGNQNKDVRWLCGMIDFAGSGVVHMTGGWAALVAAYVLKPRTGRFQEPESFGGHSLALSVMGTFVLWIGWYGFNQGSTLGLSGQAQVAARVGVTTTLSAASGAVMGLYLKRLLPASLGGSGVWDLAHTCNSLLGGLVGITAGCSVVEPYAALVIGALAAVVYHSASCAMRRLRIDDPLDAFAVHGSCGALGVLAVGFFATHEYTYAFNDDGDKEAGVFYGGSGLLLASQFCGMCVMVLWVVFTSVVLFKTLDKFGIFRVSWKDEMAGLDTSKHGGSAYPEWLSVAGTLCKETADGPQASAQALAPGVASTTGSAPPTSECEVVVNKAV